MQCGHVWNTCLHVLKFLYVHVQGIFHIPSSLCCASVRKEVNQGVAQMLVKLNDIEARQNALEKQLHSLCPNQPLPRLSSGCSNLEFWSFNQTKSKYVHKFPWNG